MADIKIGTLIVTEVSYLAISGPPTQHITSLEQLPILLYYFLHKFEGKGAGAGGVRGEVVKWESTIVATMLPDFKYYLSLIWIIRIFLKGQCDGEHHGY